MTSHGVNFYDDAVNVISGATVILRPYQTKLRWDVHQAWNQGAQNVAMRLDTGGGKSVILGTEVSEHSGASCVIAHRQELVSQLSLTLARYGIPHNIIASSTVRKEIIALHIIELGRSYYNPGARCVVASVDTLVRAEGLDAWFPQVTLWIVDEAHHLVLDNKWHTAVSKFTNPYCRGLGPTATPRRADGKGLGRAPIGDGLFDALVQGPPMRWLIENHYLTDYRVVCVESDLASMLGDVGASGDYSTAQLKSAAERSHIVGDVVGAYLKFARGLLGITFTTDVDTAENITRAYRLAGVRAETLTGKTQAGMRSQILKQFARRELDQIVAVDIVSEGFDLPAIEVGSFARPTESLGLYMQQFGRVLRLLEGKKKALIIDHVNNFLRHGPPDREREWSLARREGRRKSSEGIGLRPCTECLEPYERFRVACPHCGYRPEPEGRSSPKQVDGDLVELDAATLEKLRGAVITADQSLDDYRTYLAGTGLHSMGVMANVKHHAAALEARKELREAMAMWGGWRRAEGLSDREAQKAFYLTFGMDVLTAQTLNRADTESLRERLTASSRLVK